MAQGAIRIDQRGTVLWVSGGYHWIEELKQCGGRFLPSAKAWILPCDLETAETFEGLVNSSGGRVHWSDNAVRWKDAEAYRQGFLTGLRSGGHGPGPLPRVVTKVPPMDHQWAGIHWLAQCRRAALIDDMGLGKTKQAIDAATWVSRDDPIVRPVIVVVCPNSIRFKWGEEIEANAGTFSEVRVPVGSTKERAKQVGAPRDSDRDLWIILNYECLRYFPEVFLEACRSGILICDEAHRLKDGRTGIAKLIAKAEPAYLWMLTGTPVANRPQDVWSLTNILRPGLLGFSYSRFERDYLVVDRWGNPKACSNPEQLAKKWATVSLGRKKEECIDLPAKIFERRDVELSAGERRAYDRMRDEMVTWLDEEAGGQDRLTVSQAANFASRLTRLRQLTDGLVSEGQGLRESWSKDLTKLQAVREIWEDSGRQPMVVWCQWVPVVRRLFTLFEEQECRPWMIHGGINVDHRHEILEHWGNGIGTVLICQMDTAGEGLNLHHAALQVFVDVPWTPRQRLQCIDRLHRIGQTRSVVIVDILAHNTVDRKVFRKLMEKIDDAEEATRGSFPDFCNVKRCKDLLE